ncbi:MAG: SMP-30/gluconolactonase/LRE family protein [Novosphingobium sp.]|nr:SMP-30/gluconolactonase/LRE family protein [Novosphingobium sp.]
MAEFETVTDGLGFPEGPVALPDGSVIVVETFAGKITRVRPDGTKQVVAEPGGGPNGLAFGPDGRLYCVNNGGYQSWTDPRGREFTHGVRPDFAGGWVERIDIDSGKVEVLYRSGDFGHALRGPNDIVFDANGGFWFTDHGKLDYQRRCHDIVGIFYARTDGSLLDEVIFPSRNPNGIGLSPDGTRLYAAETYTTSLVEFTVTGPGQVADDDAGPRPGRVINRPGGRGYFDSLAVEANGNICVATPGSAGGISVISPAGELIEFVECDDPIVTNICFGGPDMRDAWLTFSGSGRLVKTRWPRPGLRLNFQLA